MSQQFPASRGRLRWRALRLTAASLLAAGCATVCPPTTADGGAGLSAERRMLSEGYSILRHDAEIFSRARLILYAKFETDDFDDLVSAVSAFGRKLSADLERIARDYPGVRTDLDPLPELEKRKRRATAIDKALTFVPVVGKSGAEYERTVLISLANGMNQERHLVMELTDAETDAGLKDFLRGVQVTMDALYERAENLLRKHHYRNASAR